MVSPEAPQATFKSAVEPISSPGRISFSAEFLDENNFISICPNGHLEEGEGEREKAARNVEFEFLSGNLTNMMTADELFCEGKLLPFWQKHHAEKLSKISLKTENAEEGSEETEPNKEESRISWFLDDDPSPRPPKCTVLWKELLRLKKQRASSNLSSPSSSSSSSSSSGRSVAEIPSADGRKEGAGGRRGKVVKRVKKGLERTRSATMRIRPVINVPICTQGKNSGLPPLFSMRRGKLES